LAQAIWAQPWSSQACAAPQTAPGAPGEMPAFGSRRPAPRCPGRRLLSAGALCLGVSLASGLIGGLSAAFTAPQPRCAVAPAAGGGRSAVAPAVGAAGPGDAAGGVAEGGASTAGNLEALRQESLEACIVATEDDPDAVERCATLSYELANAEQLMFKRQAAFRYVDSDSY